MLGLDHPYEPILIELLLCGIARFQDSIRIEQEQVSKVRDSGWPQLGHRLMSLRDSKRLGRGMDRGYVSHLTQEDAVTEPRPPGNL
jgi:hypothetical protein